MSESFQEHIAALRAEVESALERSLPAQEAEDPGRLHEAMRYAVLGGGKRLRPLLCVTSFEACAGRKDNLSRDTVLRVACAVELVHCYSLVHDDLPAMDDDDIRRGRPTVHRAFDEATAILAGDALLTLAFEWVAVAGAEAVCALAREAGHLGMIRGQARDLSGSGKTPSTFLALETLHREKTGALFAAAAEIGGILAKAPAETVAALSHFGTCIGIAFQHADDVDDQEHERFRAEAKARVPQLLGEAEARISGLGAPHLSAIARLIAG